MGIMDLEDLVEETLDEFLLECVGNKAEEISQLPAMLDGIEYLLDKDELIAKTDFCEMFEVGDSSADHCYEENGELHVLYSLDYILQTGIDGEPVWRIQGTIKAHLVMPDRKSADWNEFADDENNFSELYEKYRPLVRFESIDYVFIEAGIMDC